MPNWLYKDQEIKNIEDIGTIIPFGFIYITTHTPTGKKYLGKKSFYYTSNVKLGKKEIANLPVTRGRSKLTKQVIKESDWKSYYGSEEFIKQKIKEKKHDDFTREIIQFVPNKKLLTYYECKLQFTYGVLESEEWMNTNILGKFYSKDFAFEY
jgi:hypothetical protein